MCSDNKKSSNSNIKEKCSLVVSIVPQETFVKVVGGDKLDADIKGSMLYLKKKAFTCYHPAFGYFADGYGINMV